MTLGRNGIEGRQVPNPVKTHLDSATLQMILKPLGKYPMD